MTGWHTGAVPDLPPLAEFLRTHRERLSPEHVGLQPNSRRRTPGLRREEVATLAGVSIDYLVRLEQGRDTNPSDDVLLALAGALQLDTAETRHLMALKSIGASPQMEQLCPAAPSLASDVAPTVRSMVDALDPTPAHLVGPLGDVLASNASWRTLVAPIGLHDGANLALHLFEHPSSYLDWDAAADAEVARLRAFQFQLGEDEQFLTLVDRLMAAPGFADRWNGRSTSIDPRGRLGLSHPDLGELSVDVESADFAADHHRLVVWQPADATTSAAFQHLTGDVPVSPAQLRLVGDP